MKRITFLVFAALVLFSCGKDEQLFDADTALSANLATINFAGEGGSRTFKITSNADWKVDCPSHWWISRTEGKGDAEITVTAQENLSINTYVGKITITAGGLLPVEIKLEQLGSAPNILVSPAEISATSAKTSVSIEVTANTEYRYSVSESWLRIVAHENNRLLLEIDENVTIEERMAEIAVTCDQEVANKVIPVKQDGLSPFIKVVGSNAKSISIDDKEVSIVIESTDECDISFTDDWLTLSAEKSTKAGLVYTFVFAVSDYSGNAQRRMSVSFTQKTHPDLQVAVDVLQSGRGSLPEITLTGEPAGGFVFDARQWVRINPEITDADNITWSVNGQAIASEAALMHVMTTAGNYTFRVTATNAYGENFEEVPVTIRSKTYENNISKVLDFVPAPGQFVNQMPAWANGDSQESMNAKTLSAIRNKNGISLGGFGGYVVMGLDHVLVNTEGAYDFRVKGNAMATWSEPGVIMVSYDANGNGLPDDEWFEIAGSAYNAPATIKDYEITYTLTATIPNMIITWTDNQGISGEIRKNAYHGQSYFPEWLTDKSYTLKGTRLTEEGVYDTSGSGTYWVSMPFEYGYVDNCMETQDCSKIKLDWAVDKNGQPVKLKGVDFIRVHCAMNVVAGWLGEVSTEVYGFEEFNMQ